MSQNPVYFLSSTPNSCSFNGTTIHADLNTENGNLCAYISGVPRVWACPAQINVCWSWDYSCHGGDSTTPDSTQQVCNSNGITWCCDREWEVCTQTEGQSSICWATFKNPNHQLNASEAVAFDSTAYSTLTSMAKTGSTATVSSYTGPVPTTLPQNQTTLTNAAPNNSSTSSSLSSANRPSRPTPWIAAVSALVGLIIVGLVAFFVRRYFPRFLNHRQIVKQRGTQAVQVAQELPVDHGLVEADGRYMKRSELSAGAENYELQGDIPIEK